MPTLLQIIQKESGTETDTKKVEPLTLANFSLPIARQFNLYTPQTEQDETAATKTLQRIRSTLDAFRRAEAIAILTLNPSEKVLVTEGKK